MSIVQSTAVHGILTHRQDLEESYVDVVLRHSFETRISQNKHYVVKSKRIPQDRMIAIKPSPPVVSPVETV